jgi:hypothetical protein
VNPDVPKLGDENTPYEDVLKFYSFWYNFKSWRDFSYLDEYDPSEAETREEKRWMERRNARLQAKRKREEMQRITKLVDTAYKLDPRIKKYREEQQARKEQMKRERQEALRKKKEEEERKLEEERKKKEEEERKRQEEAIAKKKEKEKLKKAIKKRRQQIRQFCAEVKYSSDNADLLLSNVDSLDKLNAICAAIERSNEEGIRALDKEVELLQQEIKKKAQLPPPTTSSASVSNSSSSKERSMWSADEIHLLSRALARYPVGTQNRWQLIADFIGTRTVKEVIAKVKQVQQEELKTQPQTRELESQFARWQREKEKKATNAKRYEWTPSQRFDDVKTIAEVSISTLRELEGKTDDEISQQSTNENSSQAKEQNITAQSPQIIEKSETRQQSKGLPSTAPQPESSSIDKRNETEESKKGSKDEKKHEELAAVSSDVLNWTAEEQKALERALKKYPTTVADRWDKIATEVPGKSKKDCILRYKYLVDIIKKSKK